MKICILSYIYPVKENKTLGIFVHHQARELAKFNEVHVVTKYHKNMRGYELVDGVKVHRVGNINFNFGVVKKMMSLNSKLNFDVIHAHFLGISTLIQGITSKIIRVPFVVTLHGAEIFSKGIIKRFCLLFPKKVMCVSHYTANLAKRLTDKNKISIVYNGIDTKRLRPTKSKKMFTKQIGLINKKIILSVGDLVKRKGFDTVIKALPSLIKLFPSLTYVIIGRGPEKQNLILQSKKLTVEKYIRYVDYVSDEELSNYYNACDIFVLMSRTLTKEMGVEGFGIVFIEASLFCKPVIAGKSGGTSDAVIDGVTGFLIDSTNINEFQKKISLLLKNPGLRKKFGKNGRDRVVKNMLWKHNSQRTVRVYNDAIKSYNEKIQLH